MSLIERIQKTRAGTHLNTPDGRNGSKNDEGSVAIEIIIFTIIAIGGLYLLYRALSPPKRRKPPGI